MGKLTETGQMKADFGEDVKPPFPAHMIRPYRFECWEEGPVMRFLAMCRSKHHVSAWLILHDRETGSLQAGEARFALASPSPLLAPRGHVAAAIALEEATPVDYGDFGLPDEKDSKVAEKIVTHVSMGLRTPDDWLLYTDPDGASGGEMAVVLFGAPQGKAPGEADGYVDLRKGSYVGRVRPRAPRPLPEWQPDGIEPVRHDFTDLDGEIDRGVIMDRVKEDYRRAFEPFKDRFAHDEAVPLLLNDWTHQAHALYAEPGERGNRFRQAGRLYPAFAPALAWDPALRSLVEAGRPYEDALRDKINGWIEARPGQGFTKAGVRRLRTFVRRHGDWSRDIKLRLELASPFPVEWLPTSEDHWHRYQALGMDIADMARLYDLSLVDLLTPFTGDWGALWDRFTEVTGGRNEWHRAFHLTHDPVRHLHDTLVEPMALFLGWDAKEANAPGSALRRLSGRLLYGGKTIFGVIGVSDEWHGGLNEIGGGLPVDPQDTAWPALIEPYTAPNGLVIVPLADRDALKAEGAAGPDANGAPGLDHCVGTYARQCREGEVHILSVRRLLGDGGYERLSTLALAHDARRGRWREREHTGLRNVGAPAEAREAVSALLAGLREGLIPVNPDALEERVAQKDGTYDWRDPENLRQALDAWRPYLPRHVHAAGIEGIAEMIGRPLGAQDTQDRLDGDGFAGRRWGIAP